MIAAKRGHFLLFQYTFVSPTKIFFRFQNKQTETKEGSKKRNKDVKKWRLLSGRSVWREDSYTKEDYFTRFHSGQCLTPLIMKLCDKELYWRYHKWNLKLKVSAGFQNGA